MKHLLHQGTSGALAYQSQINVFQFSCDTMWCSVASLGLNFYIRRSSSLCIISTVESQYPLVSRNSHVNCCFCSFVQLCPAPWDPINCHMPGFPILHHFPELAQTHVRWVSDIIQPSCPLSSPSLFVFNLSEQQGSFPMSQLFTSEGHSIGVSASV